MLPKYSKFFLIFILIFCIDYTGIVIHIFELQYDKYFSYPMVEETQVSIGDAFINQIGAKHNLMFHQNISKKCYGQQPGLILLIKSAVKNYQQRAVIRRTWGLENRFSDVVIKRIFLLGSLPDTNAMKAVNDEAVKFSDILQMDFLDTYYNNTLKLFEAIDWTVQYCPEASFYMFVDDDYYVSMKNVLRFVKQSAHYPNQFFSDMKQAENLFAGYVMQTAPHRHKFSKWFVSLKEYPFDKWPPYVTAGAFVLSNKTLKKLHYTLLRTKLFRFDDIYLGIGALKANITLTHCEYFYFKKPKFQTPNNYKHIIASHGYTNFLEMETVWKDCYEQHFA